VEREATTAAMFMKYSSQETRWSPMTLVYHARPALGTGDRVDLLVSAASWTGSRH
jgi:hypothetical protein